MDVLKYPCIKTRPRYQSGPTRYGLSVLGSVLLNTSKESTVKPQAIQAEKLKKSISVLRSPGMIRHAPINACKGGWNYYYNFLDSIINKKISNDCYQYFVFVILSKTHCEYNGRQRGLSVQTDVREDLGEVSLTSSGKTQPATMVFKCETFRVQTNNSV